MTVEIVEEYEIADSNLIKLYMNSFPAVERRPIEKLNEMVKNDEKYHLYIVKEDNSIIGFSLVCELPDEKVSLLDYMVINDSFQ